MGESQKLAYSHAPFRRDKDKERSLGLLFDPKIFYRRMIPFGARQWQASKHGNTTDGGPMMT
jgi:hypothetical protein